MKFERHLNFLTKKTGFSKKELRVKIDDMSSQGMKGTQIFNELLIGTGENNHASSPRMVKNERHGNKKFIARFGNGVCQKNDSVDVNDVDRL